MPDGRAAPSPAPKVARLHEHLLPEINLKATGLPSRGLAYPKNCEISYRPYTFGEIQKINQSKLSHKGKLSFVMDGIHTSFDKEDLTLSDISYIALLRKISTIGGHKANVVITCRGCHKEYTQMIDFGTSTSQIEFFDLQAPELPVIVTFSNNQEFSFMPLTYKKFVKIMEEGQEQDVTALIAHQCMDGDFKHIYKIVENATFEDQMLLQELDELLKHNLKPLTIVCQNRIQDQPCLHENKIELTGGDALLLPFREPKKPSQSRIRFGTKAQH